MTQSGIQAATSEFQQKQANEDIRPIQSSAGHGIIKDIEKNQNQWAANLAKQHDQLIEYELEENILFLSFIIFHFMNFQKV